MCTDKQNLFAILYVETSNACEAYRQAYSTENMSAHAIGVEAFRLKRNPNVENKILELRALHADRHDVTVDKIVLELNDLIDHSISLGKISAGVSAVLAKAKLYGLIVDQTKLSGGFENFSPPTIIFTNEPDSGSDKTSLES